MAGRRLRPSPRSLWTQGRLAVRLLKDGRVPSWTKGLLVLALVYLLSPIDLIPDFAVPGLGYADDLVILFLSLRAFIGLCPSHLVREHVERLSGRAP